MSADPGAVNPQGTSQSSVTLPTAGAQRRTIRVLVGSQVLGGVGVASGISVSGLLGERLSGSTTLSGLVGTTTVLGAAIAAVPLVRVSSRHGRRPGLALGWAIGAVGATVMVLGAVWGSFILLLLGALLFGVSNAANLQSRYAATDLALPAHRGRALSVVVWGTTVGAVLGPNLTGPGAALARSLGLPELSGPLLFAVVSFALGGVLIAVLLRPDPLLLARREAAEEVRPAYRLKESIRIVAASPGARLGVVAVSLGHAVMVAVMTMTPVHLRHHGAELRVIGLVISVHIAGMYAFSPLMGWLVDRLGRVPVIVGAQGLLVGATFVAGRAGHGSIGVGVGLFLLGTGWSAAVVAGSTLLSESVEARARPAVQGVADLAMNGAGALGGAGAGVLLGHLGYGGLNAVSAVLVVPVLALAALTWWGSRRNPTLPAPAVVQLG